MHWADDKANVEITYITPAATGRCQSSGCVLKHYNTKRNLMFMHALHTETAEEAGPGLVNAVGILTVFLFHVLQVRAAGAVKKGVLELAHRDRLRSSLLCISATALKQAIAAEVRRSITQLASNTARCHPHRHGEARNQNPLRNATEQAQTGQKVRDDTALRRFSRLPVLALTDHPALLISLNESWTWLHSITTIDTKAQAHISCLSAWVVHPSHGHSSLHALV